MRAMLAAKRVSLRFVRIAHHHLLVAKIGRNQICPLCDSGLKYKHCCGSHAHPPDAGVSPQSEDVQRHLALAVARHNAREHQRRLMQGLGRPIVSFTFHGYRFVAVGPTLFYGKTWQTFPDLLDHYLKEAMARSWGMAEQAKPAASRHPLLRWNQKVGEFQKANAATNRDGICSANATGAVRAYFGLAYDLYLCAHNAKLPDRLIRRLRNMQQFEGALYEAFVIGCFAKAGFTIEFEDEADATASHCEFTATDNATKRKFSVEAKTVYTTSKRSGASTERPRLRGYLAEALRKDAAHPRIVFIELSRAHVLDELGQPEWLAYMKEQIEAAEAEMTINDQPAPPAYLFVTNRPFIHDLDREGPGEMYMAVGFRIPDFPPGKSPGTVLEMYRARERHIEVYRLLKAIDSHRQVPLTFDDSLPEETFAPSRPARLLVGESYEVEGPGGVVRATLIDALVIEPKSEAMCTYRAPDGTTFHASAPLSREEMTIYRSSPGTFFGVLQHIPKGIHTPLDAFDFAFATYSKSTRETLLQFMANWPDIEQLRKLSQRDLAEQYCAYLATAMWMQIEGGKTDLAHT